jgi:Domain of unknown function (DUF3523)
VRWEEQRKAQQQDAYNKQEVAKYQDQLARQRLEAEHQKHRERNMELVRLQVPMLHALLSWLVERSRGAHRRHTSALRPCQLLDKRVTSLLSRYAL